MRNIERKGKKRKEKGGAFLFSSVSKRGEEKGGARDKIAILNNCIGSPMSILFDVPALVAYFNATLYTILGIASGRRALNMRGTRMVGLEETIYEDRCCIIEAMVDTSHTGCILD